MEVADAAQDIAPGPIGTLDRGDPTAGCPVATLHDSTDGVGTARGVTRAGQGRAHDTVQVRHDMRFAWGCTVGVGVGVGECVSRDRRDDMRARHPVNGRSQPAKALQSSDQVLAAATRNRRRKDLPDEAKILRPSV
ncbi:hypothetical protein CIB48_g10698 [Xylaria polymorpha]|nr:hypothetical protein CIB48_g10698 [Xylaria polymorpha]